MAITAHQQLLDDIHNTIQGMDKNSAKAILSMVDRMLETFRSRADDVANWPNVRSFSQGRLNNTTDRGPFDSPSITSLGNRISRI
jgi:hypothetical protein